MSEDIVEKSIQCLANAKLNDTTYEVARDIVLEEIERLNKEREIDIKYNKYLQKELAKANSIIKEAREYINQKEISIIYQEPGLQMTSVKNELLEILDKENK